MGNTDNPGDNSPSREAPAEQVQIERKVFSFGLGENPRGRFLRITEDVSGRRDTIIVPLSGVLAFREALDRVIASCPEANPPTSPGPPLGG